MTFFSETIHFTMNVGNDMIESIIVLTSKPKNELSALSFPKILRK